MSERYIAFDVETPNYANNRMSAIGVELDHHHAGRDSRACAEIMLHYLDGGASVRTYIRTYDLLHLRTVGSYRR